VQAVESFLGHATAAETLDTYPQLWPNDDDRIGASIDAAYRPDSTIQRHRCRPFGDARVGDSAPSDTYKLNVCDMEVHFGAMDVQRTGRIFGWLFLGTFVTSIPARLLFVNGLGASWSDMRFVPGATSAAQLKLGAFLEFGLIVTQIGTAVVLYPLVRRDYPTLGISYVSARTMESVFAAIGLISLMSVVTLAGSLTSATGGDATALGVSADSLVKTYEWAFQWGPGLVAGIGNGLILGYMMYRSELVPRRMALLGLVGGSLLILSHILIVCGAYKQGEGPSGIFTLPEAAWELWLGIYTAWKGFRRNNRLTRPVVAQGDPSGFSEAKYS